MKRKNVENDRYAETRGNNGQFGPGNPGRPPGSTTEFQRQMEAAFKEDAALMVELVRKKILEGDDGAWRAAWERLWPAKQIHEHSGHIGHGPEDTEALETRLDRLATEGEAEEALGLPPAERVSGPH